jgi:hypothetical protein
MVSIARNGKLVRNINESDLREHLMNIMIQQETTGWLRRPRKKPVVVDAAEVNKTKSD